MAVVQQRPVFALAPFNQGQNRIYQEASSMSLQTQFSDYAETQKKVLEQAIASHPGVQAGLIVVALACLVAAVLGALWVKRKLF
jgi:hypothetical protein